VEVEADLHHDGSEIDNREVGDLSFTIDIDDISASLFLGPGRSLGSLSVLDDDWKKRSLSRSDLRLRTAHTCLIQSQFLAPARTLVLVHISYSMAELMKNHTAFFVRDSGV
jgi:hypothetical protein